MQTFDKQWEKVHSEKNWGKYPTEEVIRFVARNFFKCENRKSIKILDFGCGTGANAWFVSREGFDLIAFDGSFSALKKARKNCLESINNASFLNADGGQLPFKNNSFDAIIDSAAISANSLSGIRQLLKESFRVLKPGGKFFSSGLFKRSMTGYKSGDQIDNHSFRNIKIGALSGIGTVHFFSKREIVAEWGKIGFRELQIDSIERSDNNSKTWVKYFVAQSTKPE